MGLGPYVGRRILAAIPILWIVLTLTFVGFRLAPGDAAQSAIAHAYPEGGQGQVPPQILRQVRYRLGLDRPVLVQYGNYLSHAVRLDFGRSYTDDRPVMAEIGDRFPYTLEIAAAALFLALFFGMSMGMCAAVLDRRAAGGAIVGLGAIGLSIPTFWLGGMLALLFGVILRWLPVTGPGDLRHLILPAITVAVGLSAVIMRYTRAGFVEVLSSDYVRVAHAKGLRRRAILLRHGVPNAVTPLITILGLILAGLLSGVVIVEKIFAWPGLGLLALDAVSNRDYPVIQGLAFVAALVVIGINLLVDVLHRAIDPRIRRSMNR